MMVLPTRLLDLLDALKSDAPSQFRIAEDAVSCTIQCRCSVNRQHEIAALQEALEEHVERLELQEALTDLPLRRQDLGSEDIEQAELLVFFRVVGGTRPVLTVQGFSDLLSRGLSGIRRVLIAEDFAEFAVGSTWVSPWRSARADVVPLDTTPIEDLRQLVVEAGTDLLPARIDDWLLTHGPSNASAVFDEYCRLAWPKLCAMLFSRVTRTQAGGEGRWRGEKHRSLQLQPGSVSIGADDLRIVSEAVRWIAHSENGMDMRHAFLTGELAATHFPPCELVSFIRSHLSSARERAAEAYRLYANGLSEKVVRAVTELRKALMEDVGRQVTFSKELSSQLWKDSALGVAALAAKYLIEPGRTDRELPMLFGASVGTVALIGVICLMWAHFALTLYGNYEFHHSIADTREKWRGHLHGALGADEYKALYEDPLAKARKTYHSQCLFISLLYAAITGVGVAVVQRPIPATKLQVATPVPVPVVVDSVDRSRSSRGSEVGRTDADRGTQSAGRPVGAGDSASAKR